MFAALKPFYKITSKKMEGKPFQIPPPTKTRIPTSYREYAHSLDGDEIVDHDQEWGFFVDIDSVPKGITRQKNTPPIKIQYSYYYKYAQTYTYFRSNKIVHEDIKYSSVDSFHNIVCFEENTLNPELVPALVVVPSSTYLYQKLLKIIRQPGPRTSRTSRWCYKLTVVSFLVITCMSCAVFLACIAFV